MSVPTTSTPASLSAGTRRGITWYVWSAVGLIAVAVTLVGFTLAHASQAAPPAQEAPLATGSLSGPALIAELQRGGYVLFVRHTATNAEEKDSTTNYEDCGKQRNLNNTGRDQATRLGESFKRQQVPIGRVLTSPYCRTRQVTELAFGAGTVEADLRSRTQADKDNQTVIVDATLRRLLSTPVGRGANLILVGHKDNMTPVGGIDLLEGETAVFAPLGSGQFRLVGRLRLEDWP